MLGLPLAALAVVAVLLSINLGSSKPAQADFPHAGVDFSIGIDAACDSSGTPTGKCEQALGGPFKVTAKLNSNGGEAMSGYDTVLNYTAGLTLVNDKPSVPAGGPNQALVQQGSPNNWPPCGFPASNLVTIGTAAVGCGLGIGGVPATYTGPLYQINFECNGTVTSSETVTLVHGTGNTSITAADGVTTHGEAGGTSESITINCVAATFTPLPTATSTPPPIPRMQKDCDAAEGVQTLCNVFLTRQGAKIPPVRCEESTNVIAINEVINQVPVTINPKGELQDVAAFEFEVRFDSKKVCVNLVPAQQWVDAGAICLVRDKDSSTLEGIAQIGCVTSGKGVDTDGLNLATIEVRPQPELYSVIRPNQDNGQVVQILNQNCELADEQGMPVPIFSCEDADITFRFLEGDVDGPDCDVDVFDTQQVAFRWGANKGSLLYNSFMDLEPSGHGVNGDGDIDIKDIQFVFGRFGSEGIPQKVAKGVSGGGCTGDGTTIWPPQLPVNPKV